MKILFSADETAKILRMSTGHLCRLRTAGNGPVPTYIGRNARYAASDIADFINAGRQSDIEPEVSTLDLIAEAHYADVDAALDLIEAHNEDITPEQRQRLIQLTSYSSTDSVARALSIVDGAA